MPESILTILIAGLATYLIHSTVLLGSVALLTRWNPFKPPAVADRLWKVALIGSLFTTGLHMIGVSGGWQMQLGAFDEGQTAQVEAAWAAQGDPSLTLGVECPPLSSCTASAATSVVPLSSSKKLSTTPIDQETSHVARRTPDQVQGKLPHVAHRTLLLFWFIGMFGIGLRFGIGRWLFFRRIGPRRLLVGHMLNKRLEVLCQIRGTVRPLRLTHSEQLTSPIALGPSEICVPDRALDGLTPDQQEAMLAHEMAHLVRRDPLWIKVFALFEIVFFFQPLNMWARKRQQAAAEHLCDAWAVRKTGKPNALASCLVEVAGWMQRGGPHWRVAAVAGSPLHTRIYHLLQNQWSEEKIMSRFKQSLSALVIVCLVTWLVPGVSFTQDAPPPPPPPPAPIVVPALVAPTAPVVAPTLETIPALPAPEAPVLAPSVRALEAPVVAPLTESLEALPDLPSAPVPPVEAAAPVPVPPVPAIAPVPDDTTKKAKKKQIKEMEMALQYAKQEMEGLYLQQQMLRAELEQAELELKMKELELQHMHAMLKLEANGKLAEGETMKNTEAQLAKVEELQALNHKLAVQKLNQAYEQAKLHQSYIEYQAQKERMDVEQRLKRLEAERQFIEQQMQKQRKN